MDLETSWARFLANDVDVATTMSIENADIDGRRFAELRQQLPSASVAEKRKLADELRRMLEKVPSAEVHDMVAHALAAAEAPREALAVRVEALAFTPTWDPVLAPRLVGNIGDGLVDLDELDPAQTWLERALAWDPANPFVLASLATLHRKRGDLAHAEALEAHVARPLYATLGAKKSSASPYRPSLEGLRTLDARGLARVLAVNSFSRNRTLVEAGRAHALAAAMHGDFATARLMIALVLAEEEEESLPREWLRDLDALFATRAELPPVEIEARAELLGQAQEARDEAPLVAALAAPEVGLRFAAAEALALDLGSDRADAFLEELSRAEEAAGQSNYALSDAMTASAIVFARRAKDARAHHPVLVIPREGAAHPLFDRPLGKKEVLSFQLRWPGRIGPNDIPELDPLLAAAARLIDDDKAQVSVDGDGQTLSVVLTHCSKPRAAVDAIVRTFAESPLSLREIDVFRLELPKKKDSFPHAVDDPRAKYSYDYERDELWAASFDPEKTAPAPEPEGGLSIWLPSAQGQLVELRPTPFFHPQVRICYGLARVDDLPDDDRTRMVESSLLEALERAFGGLPPRILHRDGASHPLSTIGHAGRRGYAIAFRGLRPEMIVRYPHTFRFREHELFGAMTDTVLAQELAPAVHWWRGEGTWIVNLWERS